MDGLELRQQMMQSLALGLKNMAEERKATNSGYRYAELTGSIETMRTMLEFLINAEVGPSEGVGADKAPPGPPVDGESKPKRRGRKA